MRKALYIFIAGLLALAACSKTPGYVIGEGDMADLLVDMHKTQALIESKPKDFFNDSLRDVAKQTVLQNHGVSREKYDTSLVWYSHNVEIFSKVYEKVIERLNKEQELIDKASGTSQGGGNTRLAQTQSGYKNYGDTADLWTLARSLVVIANMGKPALKFSAFKNQETARGDKYSLRFDIHNGMSMIDVFIAIEYSDGSLSFTSRRMPASGHVALDLQGDKRFDIRNMYGYVLFKPSEYEVLYVDNIMLLRTHLDEATYNVDNQKLLDRNKNRRIEAAKRKAEEDERRKQEQIERARHHADSIRMAFARKDSVEANSPRRPKPRSVPQRVR